MSLYKAHRRLQSRATGSASAGPLPDAARARALLEAQRGRCVVCRRGLEAPEARVDDHGGSTVVLHPDCLALVGLVRRLGPDALEAARKRL
jgi:hypothetical protein